MVISDVLVCPRQNRASPRGVPELRSLAVAVVTDVRGDMPLLRRVPSPSATASGSPNRLLCPDPVRHMSVITGPAEHATASCGDLQHRLERV